MAVEQAGQGGVVEIGDGAAVEQVVRRRGAVGVEVAVLAGHRRIAAVVDDHDQDRQALVTGQGEALDHRVVHERPVAEHGGDDAVGGGELEPERDAEPLAEPAGDAEIALRPPIGAVAHQGAAVGDGLVGEDRVRGQRRAEGGEQRRRVDAGAGPRFGERRGVGLQHRGMGAGPARPAGGRPRGVGAGGADRLGQQLQRRGAVALEELVGMEVLVDHLGVVRRLVDGDDARFGRAGAGRVPGRAGAQQQDQVGPVEEVGPADALVEVVVAGEVGVVGPAALDHRDGQRLGQLDQSAVALGLAPRGFGEDRRLFGGDQGGGDALDVGGGRAGARRRRRGAQLAGRGPAVQLGLDRHRHEDRPGGRALRHLAGADQLLEQRRRAGRLGRPFDQRLGEAVRPADHRQARQPLRAGMEPVLRAVGDGLAGDDGHRQAEPPGGVDPHRALQQADAGVQHHALHPPGEGGVADGEVDGQRLVGAAEIARPRRGGDALAGEGLPDRAPFGARRGHDVIAAEASERLDDRLAAVEGVLHGGLPRWMVDGGRWH